MRQFTFKYTVLLIVALLISNLVLSQNKYLSFNQGEISFQNQETTVEREILNMDTQDIEINFNFTGAIISETDVKGTSYQFLNIKGLAQIGQIGAPALPARNEIIAMPRDSEGKIIILETEYQEYQGYLIHPTLKPARDTEGAPEPEFQKDEAIYSKNDFFPKNIVEIVSIGLNRNTPLAKTQIRPVQYNPVTQTIRVYTKIKFKIEFIGGESSFDYIARENSVHYTNLLKLNVLNSVSIPDGISNEKLNTKTNAKNYIIITHSEFDNQANELADWKRQLGYSVEVVSQSAWTASEIKTAIHDRYENWTPKPDFFVIIGDHTGSYAVPAEIHTIDGEEFATDLYYACMDGTYDWHPDMAHGRISVSNSTEATIVVNKILNYEQTPPTNNTFYDNILNCAQYQDDDNNGFADRRFCHTSENIRDYLQDEYGYTSERVYYTSTFADITSLKYNAGYYSTGEFLPAEIRNLLFNWNSGVPEIVSGIDNGKFMVFHRDHGYVGGSGWAHPQFMTNHISQLNNGNELPVIFSINCHTGEFQLNNCFAEEFLRVENKGAVGIIAAAYYSYSGYNDALSIGMIDAIWADPGLYAIFGSGGSGNTYTIGTGNNIYTMGDVVNQGLYAMELNWGGGSSSNKYQYELFHYFGDPAMKIWTDNPNENVITATHSSDIDCAGSSFLITGSTPDAIATLVFNNKLIAEIILDVGGSGTLTYDLDEPGSTVLLTISKHNSKPYTANLSVTGTCSFAPMVSTGEATNITDNSANLSGEITDNGGEPVIESGFVYSIDPDPIIGQAGVEKVETNPLVTLGEFDIDISGLEGATSYYYKAFAVNSVGTRYGDEIILTTECNSISIFPWIVDFETISEIPVCWNQEFISGDNIEWVLAEGNGEGFPSAAYSGNQNLLLKDPESMEDKTILISPLLDLSSLSEANLTFWYYLGDSFAGPDEFRVLSRTEPTEDWTEIAFISSFVTEWTELSNILPSISETYQIAFEGNALGGRGVCIDYVTIDQKLSVNNTTEHTIEIYPNPSTGNIFVKIENESINSAINVYSINGKNVYSGKLGKTINNIDLSYLSGGIYTIQIIQSGKVQHFNLIIE